MHKIGLTPTHPSWVLATVSDMYFLKLPTSPVHQPRHHSVQNGGHVEVE